MTKTRFDHIAKSYEEAIAKYPKCRTDHFWFLEQLSKNKPRNILEISGGTGFLTSALMSLFPQSKIVVQDISQTVLDINADKNQKSHDITYYVESDMSLPKLENNQFDCIISLGGFHHIEDQIKLYKTAFRLLKQGGLFYIGDFADNSPVQKYFDEIIHFITDTGHNALFASESRLINLGRFGGFKESRTEVKKIPFCFQKKIDIGVFFQMVHALNQKPEETLQDMESMFDIMQLNEGYAIVMDYVYAWYHKQ